MKIIVTRKNGLVATINNVSEMTQHCMVNKIIYCQRGKYYEIDLEDNVLQVQVKK